MTVIVQAKSIPVTKAMHDFIVKQAEKIAKFSSNISKVTVYLEKATHRKSNDPQVASVKYHVQLPGKDIVVSRRAVDMYDAVVDATNRVTRKVRKMKEKKIHGRRTAN